MLKLRPYKKCDAKYIAQWIKDEETFRKWCADRFETYPICSEDINNHYSNFDDMDNFFQFTAFDESGVVGHMIMRFTDDKYKIIRFGFVIVDDSKRGMGYGKEMLQLAIRYAFDILKVKKITLGVFENNPSAYCCYKSVGFKDVEMTKEIKLEFFGEEWKIKELEMLDATTV